MTARGGQRNNAGNVWLGVLFLGLALMSVAPAVYTVRAALVESSLAGETSNGEESAFRIETSPEGASIYVDYRFRGVSPLEVRLAPGEHLVEAGLPGHRNAVKVISAWHGPENHTLLALEPAPSGTLTVESEPVAARVYLDGVFTGFTPLEIKTRAGRHLVEIEKANRHPVQEWVTVEPDKPLVLSHKLKDRVLEFLLAAIESDTDAIAHYMDLAHYYFIRDRMEDAVDAYKQALFASYKPGASEKDAKRLEKEIKKHMRWPGKNLAVFNKAIKAAQEEASKRFPASVRALKTKSAELEKRRNLDGAFIVWKEGTETAPENPIIWTEYARLAMRTRKMDEAMKGLLKAVELAKGDPEVLDGVMRTVHNYYRMFPVREDREKFLRFVLDKILNPVMNREDIPQEARAKALFRRAMTYEYLEEKERAVEDYKAAIAAQDTPATRAQWRERLALLLARLKRREEAIEQYRLTLEETVDRNRKAVIERRLKQLEKQIR